MALERLIGVLKDDPYFTGPNAHITQWALDDWFPAKTTQGYHLKYRVSCWVTRVDDAAFRKARMLEEPNQKALFSWWHETVFLPEFRRTKSAFMFFFGKWMAANPWLTRINGEGSSKWIGGDPNCCDFIREVRAKTVEKNGCVLRLLSLETALDESLIEENYRMFVIRNVSSVENSADYRELEESLAVALRHKKLMLERELLLAESEQKHESKSISIQTRRVGQMMEMQWNIPERSSYRLRGYRREGGGFSPTIDTLTGGTLVVDTTRRDKSVQHLKEGVEYFFTFILTHDDPVFRTSHPTDMIRAVVGSPVVESTVPSIKDSLRFVVRIPNQGEIAGHKDPVERRIENAVLAMRTEARFGEAVKRLERELIRDIKNSNCPDDEKEDRIGKIHDLANALLVSG
jgi:hypothetical protein